MKYVIQKQVAYKINTFYHNVAKKYKHTYSEEMMHKNLDNAFNPIYKIENGLLRRKPTISRWNGLFMANAGKWYFAYRIEGNTIYVEDACHSQKCVCVNYALKVNIAQFTHFYLCNT